MIRGYLALAALALAVSMALAQDKDNSKPEESCDGSTMQMAECLSRLTATWDKRLNDAYQRALKDADSDGQREQLRKAQRAWIAYRDANCLYYRMGEGTIAQLDAGECMRSLTETRAKELEGGGQPD